MAVRFCPGLRRKGSSLSDYEVGGDSARDYEEKAVPCPATK
ncbi:MAG TPA: hypothetical protein PLU85_00750 [Bacteroidia bacterium]|nr:hypothetical protein [Bacteroidia bacterium]HOZ89391.1 hypothetical protein [Bacteroidia bacterium]HQW17268.1 hypothetical protein [Bacteroidia bacterium]HQW48700.1 hypothetical protein [Bacteroidia bacterium]HQX71029.1 hypothetical protein [Bacteroidia bacterium]